MARPSEYCSTIARDAREPLAGTASHARGCVLLSYPKRMWARQALDSVGLPPALVGVLKHLGEDKDVMTRFVAHEGVWNERVEITLYPEGRRHRDVPLERAATLLGTAGPTDGEPTTTPVIACCTHGIRDRCCALFGAQIVTALRQHLEATGKDVEIREATHLGGDRFAPTVLVLPSGHMYGHLVSDDAGALIDAALGALPLRERFRGSLWRDSLEQLADVAALSLATQADERAPVLGPIERTEHDASHATLRFTASFGTRTAQLEVHCVRERRMVVGDCRSADTHRRGGVSLWTIERLTTSR